MKRVVGYYEGWAPGRACDKFKPSDIPDGVYTHLNFAFASIDPKTFQVGPAAEGDTELYCQLTQKKRIDANLKVFLAIGGLGVSCGEDFENFPKFLWNIKSALTQNGAKNGLSIAVPASYWYLQHFDIINIAKHVEFFKVMTYDLHDLLWRNQIDPDQVNLGLAFYLRTFTAFDPRCMSPGCLFSSGAPKGPCSDAVGVLSNAGVDRRISSGGSSVSLDKAAAVKILKSGRDWMTYDDADTWKIKLDFARSQCLGGAMVWAISQDTTDGKYSKQLQSLQHLYPWIFKEMQISESSKDITKQQCRWSNCGQGCPSGWKGVPRIDPYGNNQRELMYDDTGCDGRGIRVFCYPPGDQPTCQWLFFNGGKCNPGCPHDTDIVIASTKAGCNNGKAQVACCDGGSSSMDIYRQCKWAHWKNCQWYDNFALGLTPYAGQKTCNANCPAGKIKVALEKDKFLCGGGISAYCCDAVVTISAEDMKKNLKKALRAWAKEPTCPNTKGGLSSRSATDARGDEKITPTVVERDVPQVSATAVKWALEDILSHPPNSSYDDV
ncbi:hypothetical protein EsH8_V_000077 [Colletotrichum jinshuiense]